MVKTLYNHEEVIKKTKESLTTNQNISPDNKRVILEYNDYCINEKGVGVHRALHNLYCLSTLAMMLKTDFEKAKKEDIVRLVGVINNKVGVINNKEWSDWTKYGHKITLKGLYKWLRKTEQPEETCWIKIRVKQNRKLPEDMLTEEDIKQLINSCENERDKALVSLLYEVGCRLGELANIKLKHCVREKMGMKILLDGKTGMRRVPIFFSVPAISNWLNVHPCKNDREAPMWVKLGNREKDRIMDYGTFRALLLRIAKRSGIKKKVNPHNFRHSRATFLAKHLTEQQMKVYLGWVGGSDMPATYVHLSGRDIDNAVARMNGIRTEETSDKAELTLKMCEICQEENSTADMLCKKCGAPLSIKSAMELDMERENSDKLMQLLLQKVIFGDNKIVGAIQERIEQMPDIKKQIATLLKSTDEYNKQKSKN